jgi:8-oxo-dGTP diphosphatase
MAPPVHPVDVFLVLHDGGSLLLARRQNTGYDDGRWNLPSGKLEHDEDALSGMIREAREEVGIDLAPASLRLAATVHRRSGPGHARIGLVFAAASAPSEQGPPVNAEPHKCDGLGWFPAASLPADMSEYSADCIGAYLSRTPFALSGWDA